MADSLAQCKQYAQRLFTSRIFLGSMGSALGACLLRRLLASSTTYSHCTSAPSTLTDDSYRLDDKSSDTLTLPDGRKLGYAQYGSLTGKAMFYLHGLPGSRIEGIRHHELGLQLGTRIIAIDRPGYGWSSPHPGRTLLDFPKDLEHLAEHLGLDAYSVMGVSGGGPYTLACAATLPREKLKCISIVCGLGPPDISMRGADWLHWIGFPFGWRYSPLLFIRWFLQSDPTGRVDLSDDQRLQLMLSPTRLASITDEKDFAILSDKDFLRVLLRATWEAYAQGYKWVLQDGRAMCIPWGFRIEDIRPDLPVQLWYGKHDTFVPLNHGEQIAKRLGGRAQLRVEDDTHASISMNWKKQQLNKTSTCASTTTLLHQYTSLILPT